MPRIFVWNNNFLSNLCIVICHLTGKSRPFAAKFELQPILFLRVITVRRSTEFPTLSLPVHRFSPDLFCWKLGMKNHADFSTKETSFVEKSAWKSGLFCLKIRRKLRSRKVDWVFRVPSCWTSFQPAEHWALVGSTWDLSISLFDESAGNSLESLSMEGYARVFQGRLWHFANFELSGSMDGVALFY